jgi:hypothetical protein
MRRNLVITAVIVVPLLLLVVYGCTRDRRIYTRITVAYPHAPPLRVEAQIAIPIEVALAGTPYLDEVTSFCSPGKAEIDLTWNGTCDPVTLRDRLANAAEWLPAAARTPVVTTVSEVRAPVPERAVALVASVEPDQQALLRHGVREEDVWEAVMPVYAATEDVEEQLARLVQLRVKSEAGDVLLTDVATVVAAERLICIVRSFGKRL